MAMRLSDLGRLGFSFEGDSGFGPPMARGYDTGAAPAFPRNASFEPAFTPPASASAFELAPVSTPSTPAPSSFRAAANKMVAEQGALKRAAESAAVREATTGSPSLPVKPAPAAEVIKPAGSPAPTITAPPAAATAPSKKYSDFSADVLKTAFAKASVQTLKALSDAIKAGKGTWIKTPAGVKISGNAAESKKIAPLIEAELQSRSGRPTFVLATASATPAVLPAIDPNQPLPHRVGAPVLATGTPVKPDRKLNEFSAAEVTDAFSKAPTPVLQALIDAAVNKRGFTTAAGDFGPGTKALSLSVDEVLFGRSFAETELARRGADTKAKGVDVQSGAAGQKTTELAPAAPAPTPAPPTVATAAPETALAPVPVARDWSVPMTSAPAVAPVPLTKGKKAAIGVGVLALVGVGAWFWMRQQKPAPMPSQVQGWFEKPARKSRRKRR